MNWITKIIKAGEKIKTALHERASKTKFELSGVTNFSSEVCKSS